MMRKILRIFAVLIGVREAYRPYIDDGFVDFSGQGRDRYGR